MAWQGKWQGKWNGNWHGEVETTPGAMYANLSGSGGLDADITAQQAADVYPGSGYPSISAFVSPTGKRSKKRIEDRVDVAIRELYEGITATASPQVKKQAAKIVRPHIVAGVKPATIPPASIIDWAELERDTARVSALLALWQEQMESMEDEEMLLMLMAA